ncbi:unnamed protein product [Cuscuta epithymum]|uniref:Copia protein n=1 Tax=Cuscuta epithymum TaxID=186058 RepID=A0AAV0D244_9ASTE|nr:unnamed protein product [Cuscuta epithymum]
MQLFKSFKLPISSATIYCDSKSALALAANPIHHERIKHVEIDCHFIREWIQSGVIHTLYVPSRFQLADILTKPLGKDTFHFLLSKMSVQNLYSPLEGGYWSSQIKVNKEDTCTRQHTEEINRSS